MVEAHGNLIGRERRPSSSGDTFEVLAPPARPGERARSLGTWPRSGRRDVEEAIADARAAGDRWTALGASRRREILARAAAELAGDPDPGGLLAARLSLEASELSRHFAGLPEALDRALREPSEPFVDRRISEPGLYLAAPAWCELLEAPASALFAALVQGRTAVLVSDGLAPMIAESIAGALWRTGILDEVGGVVCVLHGDGDDALRAAFRAGAASYVLGSGLPARVRRLERLASRESGAGFGAGVQPGREPALDLRVLRSRSAVVAASDDPAARAAEIVDSAFGRARSLSGQLPGQVARAICPEKVLSRFTEALQAELRQNGDVARPVPFVDRDSADHLLRARVLGLDEGATLIFDGIAPESGESEPQTEGAPPSSRAPSDAILGPIVFTNVEAGMRLATIRRPTPLLCLLRAAGDEEAAVLAGRLDRLAGPDDPTLEPSSAPRAPRERGGVTERGEEGLETKGLRGR